MSNLTAHWRSLYENKYMGAWNLWVPARNDYGTVTVTIEGASFESITMQRGRKSRALVVRFKGKRTPMIITKTMGRVLERMYGPLPSGWIGHEITLYVEKGFMTSDGPGDVLRIKNTRAGDRLKSQLRGEPESAEHDEPEAFADDVGAREPGEEG